ncbi:MAG TPA: response regulator transcription factor [Acidimicrobiia bacterium]|nr:response regulator transcription factor [Acidimicrobiia bacterium]
MLVDDHDLVRHGLRTLIEATADFQVVAEAASVADAIRRIGIHEPDVIVVDLDLPDGSGLEVCRAARRVSPNSRILILTGFADQQALEAARREGVAGFVLKRVQEFDLLDDIRRVAAGDTVFRDAPTTQASRLPDDPLLARLTQRERIILQQITAGRTNREIADNLFLAEKTVKNYVSNLLTKMGIGHRAGAAAHLARIEAQSSHQYPPSEWRRRISR